MGDTPVYRYRDALYVNLTNRCPTSCAFCVKGPWKMDYRGQDLTLAREPSAEEVLAKLREMSPCAEVVFCGFGESTYRLAEMNTIGAGVRKELKVPLRLNTIGLGSLIHGRDITGDLPGCVDAARVSLNTADPRQWLKLHRPRPEFRERGFAAVQEFVRGCVRNGIDTAVTAVDLPEVDTGAVEALARELGAAFRPRPRLETE